MYQKTEGGSGKDGNQESVGTWAWGLRHGACDLLFLPDTRAVPALIDGHDGCGVVRTWMRALRVHGKLPSILVLTICCQPYQYHNFPIRQHQHNPRLARLCTRTMLMMRLFVAKTCPQPRLNTAPTQWLPWQMEDKDHERKGKKGWEDPTRCRPGTVAGTYLYPALTAGQAPSFRAPFDLLFGASTKTTVSQLCLLNSRQLHTKIWGIIPFYVLVDP